MTAGQTTQRKTRRRRILGIVALAVAVPALALARPAGAATPGTWTATGSMTVPRVYHTATLLPNGKVLVAGGYYFKPGPTPVDQRSVEIYDPTTGAWHFTGSMATARHSHTATLLPNGQVLVAGGCCPGGADTATAELWNPATGTWKATGSMHSVREDQIAVLLTTGKVLVAGGANSNSTTLASAELYDPTTGAWSATGSMHNARQDFTATLLPGGKVLVTGGEGCFLCPSLASAELYDPATGTWSLTGNMTTGRAFQAAALLKTGQVLVSGGCSGSCVTVFSGITNTAELWNPSTGTWTAKGSMSNARIWHTATTLPTGEVLVAGGEDPQRQPVAPSELYNPASGTWSTTGSMITPRELHTATLLKSGLVLAVGGFGPPLSFGSQSTKRTELYQP